MKKWLNWLLLPFLIVITFYFLLRGQDPQQIFTTLKTLSLPYIGVAIALMAVYLTCEALMLHALTNVDQHNCSLLQSFKYMFIGQFYSLITPFASGGQPMQLMVMVQDGIKPSLATAVLVNKFIYFQVGVTLYSIILFVFNWQHLVTYLFATKGLIAIGITFNTVGLFLIILSVFNANMIKALVRMIATLMRKLKIPEKKVANSEVYLIKEIDDFSTSVQFLIMHKRILVNLTMQTIIQLTAFFGITYFIYRAFGLSDKGFIEVIALQSILYMSISLIPAPGSAGVAEGGFYMVFSSLFSGGTATGAVLIWRGITYYLNLVISGIITVIATAHRGVVNSMKTGGNDGD